MLYQEQPTTSKPSKSALAEFIGALGIIEIIVGGIAMYWIWLWSWTDATPGAAKLINLFPSTSITFVDVGLLACGASLLGRLITLLVLVWVAISRKIDRKLHFLSHYQGVESALSKFNEEVGLSQLPGNTDSFELGVAHLAQWAPGQRQTLDRIRNNMVVEYSMGLLAVAYSIYFFQQDVPWWLRWGSVVAAGATWFLGWLEQQDYAQTLKVALISITAKIKKGGCDE